jgi:hypothetical protein
LDPDEKGRGEVRYRFSQWWPMRPNLGSNLGRFPTI